MLHRFHLINRIDGPDEKQRWLRWVLHPKEQILVNNLQPHIQQQQQKEPIPLEEFCRNQSQIKENKWNLRRWQQQQQHQLQEQEKGKKINRRTLLPSSRYLWYLHLTDYLQNQICQVIRRNWCWFKLWLAPTPSDVFSTTGNKRHVTWEMHKICTFMFLNKPKHCPLERLRLPVSWTCL